MVVIYSAISRPTFMCKWETVLASYKHVTPLTRENCKFLIVDSAFNDESITNEMLIEKGKEVNADVLVPKDYVGDCQRTVESVKQFFTLNWEKDVLIPLQQPYEKCFAELREYGHWFGLGGLVHNKNKIQLMEDGIRMLVKAGKRVHLFGINPTGKVFQFIREHHSEIHSLDTAKPEFAAITGKVLNVTGQWVHFPRLMGDGLGLVKGAMATLTLQVLDHITNFNGKVAGRSRRSNHLTFGNTKKKQIGVQSKLWV